MMLFAFLILSLSMCILLAMTIIFKDKYNKLLAANSFTTNVIVFIVFFAAVIENSSIIDIALVYALINFVAMIGISKFFIMKK